MRESLQEVDKKQSSWRLKKKTTTQETLQKLKKRNQKPASQGFIGHTKSYKNLGHATHSLKAGIKEKSFIIHH